MERLADRSGGQERDMGLVVKKVFTPAQANKTLPLVRQIVRDILEKGKDLRRIGEQEHRNVDDESRLEELQGDVQELMQELERIGCYFKDWGFEIGLVDFPGYVDGELVFFCWRTDEERVSWYHGIEEGFPGRKPIPPPLLAQ